MDKNIIIAELKRTAQSNGGVALGRLRFLRETGIKESDWHGKFWTKWSEAVEEAGLKSNTFTQPIEKEYILQKISELIVEIGCFPTKGQLKLKSNTDNSFPDNKVFYSKFGNKGGLMNAVREYSIQHNLFEVLNCCSTTLLEEAPEKEAVIKEEILGFVCLYKSKNYYKIGRTNDMSRRRKEIKLQLPFETQLVHEISTDDPIGIERYWHQHFASKRLNGEWFQLSLTDIKAFKRRKFM